MRGGGPYRPANGSPSASVATSSFRVAQGGKGNVTTSGTGMAGCESTIVPGFSSRARARVDGQHPAVLGALGLGGVQPPADPDRGVLEHLGRHARGGLLRADQQDAERAAALRDVDQHVLERAVPSRGAYLLSSSRTITDSGSRWPDSSFSRNVSFSSAPTTNRCAWSCSDWIATTVTLALRAVDAARLAGAHELARCARRLHAAGA